MDQKRDVLDEVVILPITQRGRDIAHQFAHQVTQQFAANSPSYFSSHQQAIATKAEQVHLNTLAVWVVNDYLTMLGIPTDLAQSDSWNPLMHLAGDMADLEIVGLGKLECRPLKDVDTRCWMPPETWASRIGYLAVAISDSQRQASLLGFTPVVNTDVVWVRDLRPLDELIDGLYSQRQAQSQAQSQAQPQAQPQAPEPTRLSQWLNGMVEAGWQQIDSLLTPERLGMTYAFRSHQSLTIDPPSPTMTHNPPTPTPPSASFIPPDEASNLTGEGTEQTIIERAKLIDLGIQLGACSVVLVVQIQQESHQKTCITLQLYPSRGEAFLRPGMALQVLDQSGEVFIQTQAREADNWIQLKFSGDRDEPFQVAITLGDVRVTELFTA